MTAEWNAAWSELEGELREGLAELDEATPELVATGHADQLMRALTTSRDAALQLARGQEWADLVRGLFDSRIQALSEGTP